MDVAVAISTERDQIPVRVVTQQAPRANVVDLETIGTAAVLASPAGLGSAEVSVVVAGRRSLCVLHLLEEFHFLLTRKQGIKSTECQEQRVGITIL